MLTIPKIKFPCHSEVIAQTNRQTDIHIETHRHTQTYRQYENITFLHTQAAKFMKNCYLKKWAQEYGVYSWARVRARGSVVEQLNFERPSVSNDSYIPQQSALLEMTTFEIGYFAPRSTVHQGVSSFMV